MTPQDFERFQTSTQDCGVLFYYAGEFTPTMIAAAADTLKGRLASEEAGSAATKRTVLFPLRRSAMYSERMPPKFEPPPAHPIITSGLIPYLSIAAFASIPIIDW